MNPHSKIDLIKMSNLNFFLKKKKIINRIKIKNIKNKKNISKLIKNLEDSNAFYSFCLIY